VAFSGQTSEFEEALQWLAQLADDTGTPPAQVFTIPGNHDVQRQVIESSSLLQMIHKELRPVDPDAVDERLDRYSKDPEAAELLLRPLANYNSFAAAFECDITAGKPFWEHDLKLNDGTILRLRGLNSAIPSDETDNDGANKLCVGSQQFTLERIDGVEYLVLCHHPPAWLRDQDGLEDQLNNRARLQMFGHKHRQRVTRINNSVRLVAGAVGPPPREPKWQPCYNFVLIRVQDVPARTMSVKVHHRVWDEGTAQFKSDGVSDSEYVLPLPAKAASHAAAKVEAVHMTPEKVALPAASKKDNQGGMDARRLLTYGFLTLAYPVRFEVAQSLGLLDERDRGLTETETYRLWFRRAAERDLLAALWDLVEKKHGRTSEANPFRKG